MRAVTLEDCILLHGDFCGGVTIGWIMGNYAMKELGVTREDDRFLETEFQNCMCDALQMVTGCTLGRGRLKVRDIGKRVIYLAKRDTGEAVKVTATPFGTKEDMLAADPSRICTAEHLTYPVPGKTKHNYIVCSGCGQEFAEDCAAVRDGRILCPDCLETLRKGE